MSKRVVIGKENFQDMNVYTRRYEIRYRILTEDRNRLSAWTNIYSIDPEVIFQPGRLETPGILTLTKVGNSVNVTWDSVSLYKKVEDTFNYIGELPTYDVWIKWAGNGGENPSDWIYKERIASTSFFINIPSSYIDETGVTRSSPKQMFVEIYRPGRPIIRFEETRSFPQNSTIVNIADNIITFPEGHGVITGTPGLYLSTTPIGGLTNNTTYYVRMIDYFSIALYPTKADALADTNRINLTGTPTGTGSFTGYTFRIYDSVITTL